LSSAYESQDWAGIRRAYQALGLAPDSSALRIKRAYRRLAKEWHPDKWPHGSPQQQRATERMRDINEAYRLVKHAPLRYHIDTQRRVSPRADQSGHVVTRETIPLTDWGEHAVRFVAGAAFGLLLDFLFIVGAGMEVPLAVTIGLPLVTGIASVLLGDEFWHWMFEFCWLWWP
jgi:hypothetical protein